MKTQRRIAGAAALLTLLAAGTTYAVDPIFRQIHWLDEQGAVMLPFSQVGEAELNPGMWDPADVQFLAVNGGGWVNISVQAPGLPEIDWVVQNLYLCFPHEAYMNESSIAVHFRLPVPPGYPLDGLLFDILVTPLPLEFMASIPLWYAPVEQSKHHVGGMAGGGSGLSAWPFNPTPWLGPDWLTIHPIRTEQTAICVSQLGLFDEAWNGCAPGACANSITYLGQTNGFDTPNPGGMYNDLYDRMQTNPVDGTTGPNMRNGKKQYTTQNKLPINTRTKDGFGDIAAVMDALGSGADVEMVMFWDPIPDGGGHAVMITSITSHGDGSYTIRYIEDPCQGDGRAETRERAVHVDSDGEFLGGQVVGFMIEQAGSPADINGDGRVGHEDLALLLSSYGLIDGAYGFLADADINGNGVVDHGDLAKLLSAYGYGE